MTFSLDTEFPYGVLQPLTPLVRRIIANNPGPFTGPGTGTYVVGRGRVAVIDPGPLDQDHRDTRIARTPDCSAASPAKR